MNETSLFYVAFDRTTLGGSYLQQNNKFTQNYKNIFFYVS